MPSVNQAAITAGVIALSMAVAAAIAVYESPELRRMADDLRRRIAIALHSLGDGVHPPTASAASREPLFNRPEDAEGFLQSRGETGVDADEETRRRQREELLYWNAQLMERQERERYEAEKKAAAAAAAATPTSTRSGSAIRGSSFDDFLQEDRTAEKGTYVFNTGADVHGNDEGLLRRRGGGEGLRGLNSSILTNPFADEHGIDMDEEMHAVLTLDLLSPGRQEVMTDIYNATPRDGRSQAAASATMSPQVLPPAVLFDADDDNRTEGGRSRTLERELAADEFMTAGQDQAQQPRTQQHQEDAYASIQAWAHMSNPGFYSPLPVSPAAPLSEPELVSERGVLTPTGSDSASLAGSGEEISRSEAASSVAGGEGVRYYDVLSDDEDGIPTPASWSEVGSVVSEGDGMVVQHA